MKSILGSTLALSLLVSPLGATWSIVVVNTRTREVAVGTATCLERDKLGKFVPVIVVGKGAGAAQSVSDNGANGRQVMFRELQAGALTPSEILVAVLDGVNSDPLRQYGIASFTGEAATFTGAGCFQWAGGVTGRVGDLSYSIQGNIVTGEAVVLAAEAALLGTEGDLSRKLMAAMQAAREFGGDGRCSCSPTAPESCGSPPLSFEKSSHVGWMGLARIGDSDGDCGPARGCATGQYYLLLFFYGGEDDPDPVDVLQLQYDQWRANLGGRPDHLLSTATLNRDSLPADGASVSTATVRLRDVEGVPLDHGGATLTVAPAPGAPVLASAGQVTDLGDGRYRFPLTAGTTSGTARFVITASDGVVTATLFPFLELELLP